MGHYTPHFFLIKNIDTLLNGKINIPVIFFSFNNFLKNNFTRKNFDEDI